MAVRDLEAFVQERASIFDAGLDVSPGSPFDTQLTQPLVRRLGTDPFTIDLSTFLYTRLNQAFPELSTSEGDAITDLLIKPVTLLWDPVVREIFRIKQGQSFKDSSRLTTDEAEGLGANIFADRDTGLYARGLARIYFAQPQNASVTPVNFVSAKGGLHFFPTEVQQIRTEEMLLNISDDGLYYFDINAIAENPGSQYNIEPDSLVSIANMPSAVKVSNLRRFRGGKDDETAEEYIARIKGELSERSLVTLRGISAKVTKSFPEVQRLNVVGFNDPEMQRDVLKGGGLGEILAASQAGAVDDDGEGKTESRRLLDATVDFTALIDSASPSSYVVTLFGAFSGTTVAQDLTVKRVVSSTILEFNEQVLVLGSTSLSWTLRKKELTLSGIPGGILFPDGPTGTVAVVDDEVHVGGADDVYVRGTDLDEATLVLDAVADDVPEASGTDSTTVAGPYIQLNEYVLGTDYQVTDDLYQLFKFAGTRGLTIQLLEGPNAGTYRIVAANQTTGQPIKLTTSPAPATVPSATNARWRVFAAVNVDLVDPKETLASGGDLVTVQGSDTITTAGGTDFDALGVAQGHVLRILDGVDAGDYTLAADPIAPSFTQLKLDRALTSTHSNLSYTVFRPNAAGGMNLPLVRITKLELLDSSGQPLGTTIPYAKPIDVQTRAFQNPARGIKIDVKDARLGVVAKPAGIRATGSIVTVGVPGLLDGETFVLSDGVNAPVTFEFDTNSSVLGGHVAVDISGATLTPSQVRDAIINAVNGVGAGLTITASSGGAALVALINDVGGAAGNVAITETVADLGFIVAGMSGGVDDQYEVTAGSTLQLRYLDIESASSTLVTVTFASGPLTRAAVVAQINSDVFAGIGQPSAAIELGTDRFGIRTARGGLVVEGGSARGALFSPDEVHTAWDIRSDEIDAAGGWVAYDASIDYTSGIDVVQVLDGVQAGIYGGPYDVLESTALRIYDPTEPSGSYYPVAVSTPRFAPEIGVHVQVGARSLGSARCYFLEPTSIEFGPDSRFSLDTENGTLDFLPDPSLSATRIPPPPSTTKPSDGSGTGNGVTFSSALQDFVQSSIQPGDELVVDYVPIFCSIALTDPVTAAGLTFVYAMDDGPDRTLTFIRDDLSLATTDVSRDGIVDQINASAGVDIASLDASNKLVFASEVSLIIRKSGTANSVILGIRDNLPAVAKYDFTLADQNNDSPHAGTYVILSVATNDLTLETRLPDSGDFSDPVTGQSFMVQRKGTQRISTTQMSDNVAEASLYYMDVELVSEGTGDHYNIDADQQMTVTGYMSDGYYLTTDDSNLSFSEIERPQLVISKTILDVGVDDDPSNAIQIAGQNMEITYERAQLVEDVNSYVLSEVERVVCSSPLARHLIPHFVRFDLTYVAGSSEDVVRPDIESYILERFPNDPLESSDLQKIVSDRGAVSIRNPIDLIAVVHNDDRSIYAARSQDSLTTGRLAAFFPDVLNIKRNTT